MQRFIRGDDLRPGMKIVGTRGGLSEVIEIGDRYGFWINVLTEHGTRQIDAEETLKIEAD